MYAGTPHDSLQHGRCQSQVVLVTLGKLVTSTFLCQQFVKKLTSWIFMYFYVFFLGFLCQQFEKKLTSWILRRQFLQLRVHVGRRRVLQQRLLLRVRGSVDRLKRIKLAQESL
jgi:hypothetical protein